MVSSMRDNVRVTSELEPRGIEHSCPRATRPRDRPHSARFVLAPVGNRARPWAGLRPLTPDGLPMIGRRAGVNDLILATGHGHKESLSAVTLKR